MALGNIDSRTVLVFKTHAIGWWLLVKALDQLFELDERQKVFSIPLAEMYKELELVTLDSKVPSQVVSLFDTARNLSLYSFFVYEFHSIAELTGFLALEKSLRLKAERHSKSLSKSSLEKIMDRAIKEGWMTEEGFPNRTEIARVRVAQRKMMESIKLLKNANSGLVDIAEPTEEEVDLEAREMKIVKLVCDSARKIRNGLAHGEVPLAPNSHSSLRMTAGLINQLFSFSHE